MLSAPARLAGSGVTLELTRHPVWLGATYTARFGRLDAGVLAAAVVDPVTQRVSVTAGLEAVGDRLDLEVLAAARLHLGVRVFGRLRLFAAFVLELPVNARRYVVEVDGQRRALADPWPVRPGAAFGASVAFL